MVIMDIKKSYILSRHIGTYFSFLFVVRRDGQKPGVSRVTQRGGIPDTHIQNVVIVVDMTKYCECYFNLLRL